jgi:hypothetical protein
MWAPLCRNAVRFFDVLAHVHHVEETVFLYVAVSTGFVVTAAIIWRLSLRS